MSELSAQSYAARLLITLPGQNKAASMVITLIPQDMLPANGRAKPLADCTLAELRAYATTLEQEVWQTYEQITLLDLDASPEVEVEVTLLAGNNSGATIEDWESHHLLLATQPQPVSDIAEKEEEEPDFKPEMPTAEAEEDEGQTGGQHDAAAAAAVSETAPEPTPEAAAQGDQPTPAAPVSPAVEKQVSEAPFVPEKEDDLHAVVTVGTPIEEEEEEPALPSPPAGVIVPSRARVRVAGRRLPPGEYTWAAVDVLLDEPPLRAMQAHALTSLDREVAGVMVGPRPEKQPDGRYVVHVIDAIAAKYTVMHGASVTYTPESWRYLNDALHERYPDDTAVMVGWYHTHPGFGIFLSGMDQFIHQNFFTQIWHVAFVLDPRARTSGFFCWDRQKTKVLRHDFFWPEWAAGSW